MTAPEPAVLVTSLSKKVPLVQAVRDAVTRVKGNAPVIGGDTDAACLGREFTDDFWHMPRLDGMAPRDLISYCREKNINAVIPTRDGELAWFARARELLAGQGIAVMVSPLPAVEICLDKMRFFTEAAALGANPIETSADLASLDASSFVVKENPGAGSAGMGLNLDKARAAEHAKSLENPIFQPYIRGTEYSVDVYINRQRTAVGGIARIRETVVNGESAVTVTRRNDRIESACTGLAEQLGLYGHAIFQGILDTDDRFHLIECNPRFGGASTLSVQAGLDSFTWFLKEAAGETVTKKDFHRTEKEIRLTRVPRDEFSA